MPKTLVTLCFAPSMYISAWKSPHVPSKLVWCLFEWHVAHYQPHVLSQQSLRSFNVSVKDPPERSAVCIYSARLSLSRKPRFHPTGRTVTHILAPVQAQHKCFSVWIIKPRTKMCLCFLSWELKSWMHTYQNNAQKEAELCEDWKHDFIFKPGKPSP